LYSYQSTSRILWTIKNHIAKNIKNMNFWIFDRHLLFFIYIQLIIIIIYPYDLIVLGESSAYNVTRTRSDIIVYNIMRIAIAVSIHSRLRLPDPPLTHRRETSTAPNKRYVNSSEKRIYNNTCRHKSVYSGVGVVGFTSVTSLPTNGAMTTTEKSCAPAATTKNKYADII